MNAPDVYLEMTPASLKLLVGDAGLEVPLARLGNGRLDPAEREGVISAVRDFLQQHGVRKGVRAFCAVGARGVSLRRMTLPAAAQEELERLLVLQIEREFPLSPEELAWGSRVLDHAPRPDQTQELLVVAVKKDVLQEYADIFTACGMTPQFTLAALARSGLVPQPPASYAVLDIGHDQSELISFENGGPVSIRTIPWGGQKLTAETDQPELASLFQGLPIGQKLYLTGAGFKGLASRLGTTIGQGTECEWVETASGEGRSAAVFGLKKSCEAGGDPPLILKLGVSPITEVTARPSPWKWAALACALLFASVALRYAEAVMQKPRLARKISEIKDYRGRLPKVDRELGFLQYLQTNQPPYLDSFFVMANAAPPGSRIESLSMNRRGDLSLRASMRDSQQVSDFRSKLIGSGMFTTVTVDEQTPTPDKQKVLVRITGQWKPSSDRKPPAAELPNPETAKPRVAVNNPKATAVGAAGTSSPPATISTSAPPRRPQE